MLLLAVVWLAIKRPATVTVVELGWARRWHYRLLLLVICKRKKHIINMPKLIVRTMTRNYLHGADRFIHVLHLVCHNCIDVFVNGNVFFQCGIGLTFPFLDFHAIPLHLCPYPYAGQTYCFAALNNSYSFRVER